MNTRLLATLSLLVILLAACAPAESHTPPPATPATPIAGSTSTPVVELTATGIEEGSLNSATPAPTVQVLATSRGPHLEATDPKTVSMASGSLQFVEFFEFW